MYMNLSGVKRTCNVMDRGVRNVGMYHITLSLFDRQPPWIESTWWEAGAVCDNEGQKGQV